MICRGLCACTEMLWMCLLYVSFGSMVRPGTFGCVAMGSALLFNVRSRLLVYYAGSGVNRVQVVLSGFSKRLFCFVQAKILLSGSSIEPLFLYIGHIIPKHHSVGTYPVLKTILKKATINSRQSV